MAGKTDTGRAVEFRVIVHASPKDVYSLWTDAQESTRFFGSDASIELRLTGLYEIVFDGPSGERLGPRGTRILKIDPPHQLSFEWEMPKFIDELNARPLPTWVELQFAPFGDDGQTEIRFAHRGFGQGESWDRGYAFFQRNWFDVLYRLKRMLDTDSWSQKP